MSLLALYALSLGHGDHERDGYHGNGNADNDVGGQRFAKHQCADNDGGDGSNTPSTEALVAPMLREAMARVAVETMVGSRASPTRLSQSAPVVIPAVIAVSELRIFPIKTIAPTMSA